MKPCIDHCASNKGRGPIWRHPFPTTSQEPTASKLAKATTRFALCQVFPNKECFYSRVTLIPGEKQIIVWCVNPRKLALYLICSPPESISTSHWRWNHEENPHLPLFVPTQLGNTVALQDARSSLAALWCNGSIWVLRWGLAWAPLAPIVGQIGPWPSRQPKHHSECHPLGMHRSMSYWDATPCGTFYGANKGWDLLSVVFSSDPLRLINAVAMSMTANDRQWSVQKKCQETIEELPLATSFSLWK